nr:hypothetical protein [Halomicroarcula sp. YJ-61-S]
MRLSRRKPRRSRRGGCHGNRKLLLWQLAADDRTFCGIRFTAKERCLQDAPVETQVDAFVDDMLVDGEIRTEYEEAVDWDILEMKHGETVDQYL